MDRRLTPFSGRSALEGLRGAVEAERFTPGEAACLAVPLADLLATPGGARDRQLLLGEAVTVIDRRDGFAFVQAAKDGYCGWLAETALGPPLEPSHWVAAPASHLYSGPKVQARERAALSLGARVQVIGEEGAFAQTTAGFVPKVHLRAIGDWAEDPVAVARSFLGTPYLWGGNSHAGLDCSGLVQLALNACGLPCPGDSDLQQAVGSALPEGAPWRRGDLLFWKGHVAMVVDAATLIHANGHSMSVAEEGIDACIARIRQAEGRDPCARRRP